MAKKKIKKNDSYFNTYSLGSRMNTINRGIDASELGGAIGGSGGLGSIANAASSTVSGLINPKGNSTGVGNAIQGIGSIASNIPGIGGVIGAGINLVGGLINAAFGSNLNEEFIAQTEDMTKQQAGYTSAAKDNSSLLNDWASYTDMAHVRKSDVGSDGWFSNKAKNKTKSLNRAIDSANLRAWHSLDNTASNIDTNNDLLAMANFSAYGGPIFSTGAIGYDLASRDLNNKQLKALSGMRLTSLPNSFNTFPDITTTNTFSDGGGIYIKPENKGKFTALKNRTGKSATWFKEHGTPAQRKMATFALNAKKWKHADGGGLYTNKEDFTTDLFNAYRAKLMKDGIRPEQANRVAAFMTMQSAYESGYGTSEASKYYNYAGHLTEGHGSPTAKYRSLNGFVDYHYNNMKDRWPSFIDAEDIDGFYDALHSGDYKYSMDSREKYLGDLHGVEGRVNGYLEDSDRGYPINTTSYEDYVASLPSNLRYTDTRLYDMEDAYNSAIRPEWVEEDKSYHLPSRNYKTGKVLKKPLHTTFLRGVLEDMSMGYYPYVEEDGLHTYTWKGNEMALGGKITNGGIFDNGIITIDNGGTHEENPFEGVQMGIDPQGVPNLVEEGEVIFNDYVFSNRMKLPKKLKKEYSIKGETFADAAKELSKESEERPNDPISKRGLGAFMNALAESQEEVRTKKEERNMNRYAKGGKLGNLFSGPGDSPQYMSRAAAKRARYKVDTDKTYTTIPVDDSARGNGKYNLSYLRFAPAIMSGVSAFTDLFNKPDYSAADRVASIDIQPALVSADPIGQYLSYRPLDRMFYINQLDKNTASGRRAVQNTSGGNRATALAGILAADYNYGENLGQLARQAEEYNQAQRERVATFNKATDMFNSQQSMQAQATNAQSRNNATQMRLTQAERVAQLRQAARDAYNARRSNNLNSFITNLGNIGWEEKQAEWLDNLAKRGVLLMNTSGEYTGGTKKNGGKLKKKRRTAYA